TEAQLDNQKLNGEEPKFKDDDGEITPKSVLYDIMVESHIKGQALKDYLLERLKANNFSAAEIRIILKDWGCHLQRTIDTASKLLQFYHPKLESIDIKNEVEHKFVIRVPDVKIQNVSEWAKLTGAQTHRLGKTLEQTQP